MVSIMEIMQLCRLCLVKEQVNIPIFEEQGEIRQIFLKITACLPVKVSKEDKLPKKICDGCLYKLELLYQFWNTTANAEKQLLSWLEQTSMDLNSKPLGDSTSQSQPSEHAVKQEKIEPSESTNENAELSTEAQSYILQQQQLPYQSDFPFKESQASNVDGADGSENSDEPLSKRRRRRQATKPIPPESLDSSENEAADSMLEMAVTKTEEESESDGDENVDDPEPSKYIAGEDAEQPGPSGLGKGGTDAPLRESTNLQTGQVHNNQAKDFGYKCGQCKRLFTKITAFAQHITERDLYLCVKCNKTFSSKCKLYSHDKACSVTFVLTEPVLKHDWNIIDVEQRDRLNILDLEENDDGLHRCETCDRIFPRAYQLRKHVAVQHDGVRFPCTLCGKSFRSKSYLNMHTREHVARKPVVCRICDKKYISRNGLRRHINMVHKNILCVCDICGKTFTTYDYLKIHRRIHSGEKPYVCEYCGKSFNNHNNFKTHKKIHTGERRHVCSLCGKGFIEKSGLDVHMVSHSDEKPFSCTLCPKNFKTKSLLKIHTKKVHSSC